MAVELLEAAAVAMAARMAADEAREEMMAAAVCREGLPVAASREVDAAAQLGGCRAMVAATLAVEDVKAVRMEAVLQAAAFPAVQVVAAPQADRE